MGWGDRARARMGRARQHSALGSTKDDLTEELIELLNAPVDWRARAYDEEEEEEEEEEEIVPPPPLPVYGPGITPREAFEDCPYAYFKQDWMLEHGGWADSRNIRDGTTPTLILEAYKGFKIPAGDLGNATRLQHGNRLWRAPTEEYQEAVWRWANGLEPTWRLFEDHEPSHPFSDRSGLWIDVGKGAPEATFASGVAVVGEGNHRIHAIRELVRKGKLARDFPIPVTLTYWGMSVEDPDAWIPYSMRLAAQRRRSQR